MTGSPVGAGCAAGGAVRKPSQIMRWFARIEAASSSQTSRSTNARTASVGRPTRKAPGRARRRRRSAAARARPAAASPACRARLAAGLRRAPVGRAARCSIAAGQWSRRYALRRRGAAPARCRRSLRPGVPLPAGSRCARAARRCRKLRVEIRGGAEVAGVGCGTSALLECRGVARRAAGRREDVHATQTASSRAESVLAALRNALVDWLSFMRMLVRRYDGHRRR